LHQAPVAAEATEEEREKVKVNAEVDAEVVAEVAPVLMMEDHAFVVTVVGSERAMRMAVRVVFLVVVAAMAMVCVPL
jgi:hypothetical protein